LTGGTALSSWYLHHRESLDIDLFSEQEVDSVWVNRWFVLNKKLIDFKSITHHEELGFNIFELEFRDGSKLRVDFNYYPSERIEKGLNWKGLQIDSLYDLAVNKLNTLAMSPRAKDYVDFYFIVKKTGWDFQRLRRDSAIKFDIHIESGSLAKQLLRVSEFFPDLPRISVPFDKKEMEDFFLRLAKSLEKEIFK